MYAVYTQRYDELIAEFNSYTEAKEFIETHKDCVIVYEPEPEK